MKQNQHIIPEVYLKQFGYQTESGIWKVPTFNVNEIPLMNKINKMLIKQSNIKSLLSEENIYDIPIEEVSKKQLELFLKLTEDNYGDIIKEIQETSQLHVKRRDMLMGFIALLFV